MHLHLEAAIRPTTVLTLARRNGVTLPCSTPEELRDWFRFRDFVHFVEVYGTISRCLRTADDYELIAYELAQELAQQNARYAEVLFRAWQGGETETQRWAAHTVDIFDLARRLGLGEHFFGGDIEAAFNYQLAPSGLTVEQLREHPAGIHVPAETRSTAVDPRVVVTQYGWWQACQDPRAPSYDPFGTRGANANLLIDPEMNDPISGAVEHRSQRCRVRKRMPSESRRA